MRVTSGARGAYDHQNCKEVTTRLCPLDACLLSRVCLDAAPGVYALVLSPVIFTDGRHAIEEMTEHTPSPQEREPEHAQNAKAINGK